MSLRNYLDSFHQAIGKIDDYGFAESIDIKEEIRPAKQAVTNARIDLVDGSVLRIRVYIDAKYKIEIISYAYQYQDAKGKLIFRYDNARHKAELGFKDHKHLLECLHREVEQMARRKRMNAKEMEKWLLSQGATPVTEEMKKEPWYAEVSKLPPCMTQEKKLPIDRQKDTTKR